MYPGSTSHATYSLVDPHGTWVTLISHARVPDVNEVSKAKARFTVSEDEVPMSTYTTMPDIIIKMLNSNIILKRETNYFCINVSYTYYAVQCSHHKLWEELV